MVSLSHEIECKSLRSEAVVGLLKGTVTMQRTMCKGKIHRATVTQANLNYVGSITIDVDLLEAADIYPYEKVQVLNVNNGSRLETYTIAGARGSGVICLNGAAARHAAEGDIVIIISYGQYDEQEIRSLEPRLVFVDAGNHITEIKRVPLIEMLPETATMVVI
jgi:aspartate 1-decarboxylase